MHRVLWAFPDRIVVHRTAAGPWMRALLPAQKREYPRPNNVDLANAIRGAVDSTPAGRGDKWHVGLPLEYFTLVNFNLPRAAEENLDQAVKYALMRHVPFELTTTYTDYRLVGNNGQLEIAAVVAQKDNIDPVLEVFAQAGLAVRSIFPGLVFWALASEEGAYLLHAAGQSEVVLSQEGKVPFHIWFRPSAQEDEEVFTSRGATLLENIPDKPDILHIIGAHAEQMPGLNVIKSTFSQAAQVQNPPLLSAKDIRTLPYSLSLLSAAGRQQEKAMRILRFSGCLFLLISLLAFPLADILGSMHYKDRLQQKVASVQDQVRELETIRNENQELVEFFDVLAQKVQAAPRAAIMLKEMTEVMPETAWLYSYHFTKEQVRIQGEGQSATAVLEALENSPMFENVQFDSPVQKSGSRDRFKIVAKVTL